ncbi:MAG TPA: hypothetical protein VK808_06295 [Bacteroidia bacterium]|jgi:hypothetical protein|nr:hypothetical protein [Bacteroidia bacterium]
MIENINDAVALVVPLVLGLMAFRYMNLLYRIYFFQLLAYIIVYILGWIVVKLLGGTSNQWLYNISMPVETGFLTWAAYLYFKEEKRKYLILIGFAAFMIIYIIDIIMKGILIIFNYGYIAESALLVMIYLLVLYSHFIKQSMNWQTSPEIWIGIGIVLYFGGVVPYFSLMHYLQSTHPTYSRELYEYIIEGLCTIRYLLLGFGFWLVRRNALAKISIVNE